MARKKKSEQEQGCEQLCAPAPIQFQREPKAKKSEFWESYNDPRWQRKRLEVMHRAEFACERCGSNDKTLNVHHSFYRKGAKPWEYQSDFLKCFCKECHDEFHRQKEQVLFMLSCLCSLGANFLVGYLKALAGMDSGSSSFICNQDEAAGYLSCFGWYDGDGYDEVIVGRWVDEQTIWSERTVYDSAMAFNG